MMLPASRLGRSVAGLVLLVVAGLGALGASTSRDVLGHIVWECLDTSLPGYCARCRWPVVGSPCGAEECRATTEIWAMSKDYVAIRDVKMCGCPRGFVHGLAMPRRPVSGVEDPRRPAGIWTFAWRVAQARIPETRDIALAVNPPHARGQDHLHVHIVALAVGARERFHAMNSTMTDRLEAVWHVAAALATRRGLGTYGVLVAEAVRGRFLVVVEPENVERVFTRSTCQRWTTMRSNASA